MPPKTPRQRRAMHAAAEGKSTIGIPKHVGKKFVFGHKNQGGKKPPRKPSGRKK